MDKLYQPNRREGKRGTQVYLPPTIRYARLVEKPPRSLPNQERQNTTGCCFSYPRDLAKRIYNSHIRGICTCHRQIAKSKTPCRRLSRGGSGAPRSPDSEHHRPASSHLPLSCLLSHPYRALSIPESGPNYTCPS